MRQVICRSVSWQLPSTSAAMTNKPNSTSIWFVVNVFCLLPLLATLTGPSRSSAMPSSTRTPTTSLCASWRTRWHGWRTCSAPRAWETSWTVSVPHHNATFSHKVYISAFLGCSKSLFSRSVHLFTSLHGFERKWYMESLSRPVECFIMCGE